MGQDSQRFLTMAMYRRWAYMVVAILVSTWLLDAAVFNFEDDKGILYIRSFDMNQEEFVVTQTELDTGLSHPWARMSVKGLYYLDKVMQWSCIACLLCFFSNRWRVRIATFTALVAGLYYVLLIYYAMQISDVHYATFYPNFKVFLPAVVCQLMILVRQNVIRSSNLRADMELEK